MGIKNLKQAKKAVRNIEKALEKELKTILRVKSRVLQTHVRAQYLTGGTTDTKLKKRTSKLSASTKPLPLKKTNKGWAAGLGFGTVYAATHIGDMPPFTLIKPKTKQFLAIPLSAAMTAAGVTRGRPLDSSVFGNTFIRKSKRGNLIIFGKAVYQKGAKAGQAHGDVVPLFVLKKQVTIKKRISPKKIIKFIKPQIIRSIEKSVLYKIKKAG